MTNSGANNFYPNNYPDTEHYLQRVLTGNVNDVSRRLLFALERLDYDFIDDVFEGNSEIHAKRNARGWGVSSMSADVLDYPRTLIIKFKPLSENLTRVTFAYIIKHPWLQQGEKDVLTREAETISSLATVRSTDKLCSVCGADSTDDSRFCRKCGASLTRDESALEILKMTAETRSGHSSVVTGVIIGLLLLILNIVGLIAALINGLGDKGVLLFLSSGIFLSLLVVISNSFGWKRLNNALRGVAKDNQPQAISAEKDLPAIYEKPANALPPPSAYSVIEDTTELLDSEKFKEEIHQPKQN